MKKKVEYILKVICYTLIFCFVHSSNVINYLKPNTKENEEYNKNVHLNAVDFVDFGITMIMSIINIFTSYNLNSSSLSRVYGKDSIGIESLLLHISMSIYEIFYQVLMEKKWLVLIHHLIVIIGFSSFIYYGIGQYYLNTLAIAEITNIFLVPFLLIKRNNIYLDKLFYIGLLTGVSFIFVRILLLPYMLYNTTVDMKYIPENKIIEINIGQFIILLIILISVYWFYKLCKGGIKEYRKLYG
uniref:TLC domain-containing protein n=1 Tax=viral metagenome TaxID=1070528 RepID=A0A6C0AW94_9ZZZZ|tara:strand:- start:1858 stop:2583 length:726 start_codon:yes stop_codon:yes gene_type:complete